MTERQITKLIDEHHDRNALLRSRFEGRSLNLSEPRPIEFQFWAWSQRDAAVLARGLYEMGFLVRLLSPSSTADEPDRWAVEAGAKIPLEQALGADLVEKLVRLSVKDDCQFDGWGASV